MTKLPNFLCIGAQKAGTTTLHDILRGHPEIFLPEIKETHFFDIRENFSQGVGWYEEFYRGSGEFPLAGDFTPEYLFFEYVPERIRTVLGRDVKLIVILRNPVDRAYSHYWFSVRRGIETFPFEKAIALEHRRIRSGFYGRAWYSYVSRGFYSEQIERYYRLFPEEQIKVVIFEEFVRDEKKNVAGILDFLGCTLPFEFERGRKVHAGDLTAREYARALRTDPSRFLDRSFLGLPGLLLSGEGKMAYPSMKRKTRLLMEEIYCEEVRALERMTGRDLSVWGIGEGKDAQEQGKVFPDIASLAALPGSSGLCMIESVNNLPVEKVGLPVRLFAESGYMVVRGWAAHAAAGRPAGSVYLDIDGRLFPVRYGIERDDVRKRLGFSGDGRYGFEAIIPLTDIGPGGGHMSLVMLTEDKDAYIRCEQILTFEVV